MDQPNKFFRPLSKFSINFDSGSSPTDYDRKKYEEAKEAAKNLAFPNRTFDFEFNRTMTGTELAISLKHTLQSNGLDPNDIAIRFITPQRLKYAMLHGTDRDDRSPVGNVDGEETWMRALGIWGAQNVTYLTRLNTTNRLNGGADIPKEAQQKYAYLIYDARALYKVGQASNGFHVFLAPPRHALIGSISDQGSIPLIKPNQLHSGSQPAP